MVIRLPHIPRRAWLTSFGLVVSTFMVLGGWLAAWYQSSSALFSVGACLAIGCEILAIWFPSAWTVPYRAWNRIARHYGNGAWLYFLVMGYLIVTAAGIGGGSKEFVRNARSGSGWLKREACFDARDDRPVQNQPRSPVQTNWITAYVSWAIKARDPLKLVLLPFLVLLSTLDLDEGGDIPTTTYTLF